MEKEPFPSRYHLFPRLERLAHFLLDQIHHDPTHSDNYRGAERLIDVTLHDEPMPMAYSDPLSRIHDLVEADYGTADTSTD